MKITFVISEDIKDSLIKEIEYRVRLVFHCPIKIITGLNHLPDAYNHIRKQYLASKFIDSIADLSKSIDERIIRVVDFDIYSPTLDFVFGEASSDTGAAVVSLYRLKYDGGDRYAGETVFIDRASKEIVHELGHTLGLSHCSDLKCVMHYSQGLADTDLKDIYFCERCRPKLKL